MSGAVADAGPLIHLAEIDALDCLSVFDTLCIPETVYAELAAGSVPSGLADLAVERVETGDGDDFPELDPGERAALAIALERDLILLTDDLSARDAADARDVDVHGSIGVLVRAYGQGVLAKATAIELMRALQSDTSLFITDAVVEHGIALLEDAA